MRRMSALILSAIIGAGVLTASPEVAVAAPESASVTVPAESIADLRARCRLAAAAYNTKCVLGMYLFTSCREYRNNFAYDVGTVPSRGLMRCRLSQAADGSGRDWFWTRWNRM